MEWSDLVASIRVVWGIKESPPLHWLISQPRKPHKQNPTVWYSTSYSLRRDLDDFVSWIDLVELVLEVLQKCSNFLWKYNWSIENLLQKKLNASSKGASLYYILTSWDSQETPPHVFLGTQCMCMGIMLKFLSFISPPPPPFCSVMLSQFLWTAVCDSWFDYLGSPLFPY